MLHLKLAQFQTLNHQLIVFRNWHHFTKTDICLKSNFICFRIRERKICVEGKIIKEGFQLDVVSVRLVKDVPLLSGQKINSPLDAINVVGEFLCGMDREIVCVINLKADNTPVNCNFASVGAINYAIVNPREIFKTSILSNAASIIMVHNHPSGNYYPSETDCMVTDKIAKISALIEILLLDHIIVGTDMKKYFSFHEKGMLVNPVFKLAKKYEDVSLNKPGIPELDCF